MDAIKAAGRALRNSPAAMRRKIAASKSHNKLQDDWLNSNDAVDVGVTFYVKFVGSEPVSSSQGSSVTEDAVFKILAKAKSLQGKGQKLRRMSITVSSSCLRLADVGSAVNIEEIPIYKVSYCTVDRKHDKIVAYIAREAESGKLVCYAYLCSDKSKAQAITLTVAQAFNIAYETWETAKTRRAQQTAALKHVQEQEKKDEADKHKQTQTQTGGDHNSRAVEDQRADSGASSGQPLATTDNQSERGKPSDASPEDVDDDLDQEFSRLARSRSNPNLLHIGGLDNDLSNDDIMTFRDGDESAACLYRIPSRDDLLDF